MSPLTTTVIASSRYRESSNPAVRTVDGGAARKFPFPRPVERRGVRHAMSRPESPGMSRKISRTRGSGTENREPRTEACAGAGDGGRPRMKDDESATLVIRVVVK
jgi:hypothetical protein